MNLGTTDDERWADAEAILDGRKEPNVGERHSRKGTFSRRNVLLFVLMLGGLTLIGVASIWGLRADHRHTGGSAGSTSIPQWREILGFVVMVSGFGLLGWGGVLLMRPGRFTREWARTASALTPEQRQQLRQQATGQAPLDPAHLSLVRLVARQVSARRSSVFVFGGVVVMQVGTAISARSVGRASVVAVLLVVMVVLAFITLRDARRAERFLAQHPGRI